ncbi:MAG: hypothetical protein FJX77_17930 [Armatimonadetes bacterium]|nr:hypothetical protein [Armatimonadota bacterium]
MLPPRGLAEDELSGSVPFARNGGSVHPGQEREGMIGGLLYATAPLSAPTAPPRCASADAPRATVNATTSYVDTSVSSGVTYYYVVTAVTGTGASSAFSNQASAIPR